MSGTLTVSAGVITDAVRADMASDSDAGESSDGLSSDSSFGVWEATTNLCTNGGLETNATGWAEIGGAGGSAARDTSTSKFGVGSLLGTFGASSSSIIGTSTSMVVTAGQTYTFSVWLRATAAGQTVRLVIIERDAADAFIKTSAGSDFDLTTEWTRYTVTVTLGGTTVRARVGIQNRETTAHAFYGDGWQLENQPLATPYVETNGSTQTRAAGRVQCAVAGTDGDLLDETSGAVLVLWRAGWGGGAGPGYRAGLFSWEKPDGSDYFFLYADSNGSNLGFNIDSNVNDFRDKTHPWSRGDVIASLAAWTGSQIKVGVNGDAFAVAARNGVVPSGMSPTFDIGDYPRYARAIDSELLFAATFDSGDITDAEWASLYARVLEGDCAPEDLTAICASATCTATFPFDTASFLDENFTIIDPENGESRGLFPHLRVEADFANDPTSGTRTWTDITADVRRLAYTRSGRNHELQRTDPGRLVATLNNQHGDYDSSNPLSPHYPGVKRNRWLRVRLRWGTTDHERWRGLVDSYRQEWPGSGKDAVVHVRATDALKVLALFDLDGLSYAAALPGVRVSDVLDDVPLTGYTIDNGVDQVPAVGPFEQGTSALAHLLDVEANENGLLFARGDGGIEFQGRHWRIINSSTALAVIGEGAGEIPYRDATLDEDDADIWNEVSVTPAGGAAAVRENTASSTSHYKRRLNRTMLSTSASLAGNAAEYLAQKYGEPEARVSAIDLLGHRAIDKWPTILAAGNSDRFAWKREATAHTIEHDVYIERVADTFTPFDGECPFVVSVELSPASSELGWRLGSASFSELGETTHVIY